MVDIISQTNRRERRRKKEKNGSKLTAQLFAGFFFSCCLALFYSMMIFNHDSRGRIHDKLNTRIIRVQRKSGIEAEQKKGCVTTSDIHQIFFPSLAFLPQLTRKVGGNGSLGFAEMKNNNLSVRMYVCWVADLITYTSFGKFCHPKKTTHLLLNQHFCDHRVSGLDLQQFP
jgi:hypothetical protein